MKKLKQILMAALISCVVSTGALAQKRGQRDDPPPKNDPPKVKVERDKNPPPERREPKGDDRKRP